MRAGRNYEIDMCTGAILPKLLRFSIPLMCSSLLQLLFNAADIVVVGKFAGDNSLAAVGSTSPIINLLVNLFIGLSVGANILAARYYGAQDRENLRQTVHTAMLLSLLGGICLAIIGSCGAKTILTWMQSPPEVLKLSTLYLRIYFLGMPAALLYNFGAALLRAVGDTQRPLYYLFTAGIINVLLNLLFVIVFQMNVAGVALATVISQCISAFLVIRCMMRNSGSFRLNLRQLRFYSDHLKSIVRIGLPAGLQGALFSLSNIVIQSAVNSLGEIIVAGNAAASNIDGFVYTAMNSFYHGTVSFTSQNYGAGKYERILPILLRAIACVIVTGLVIGGSIVLFADTLLGIYSNSPAVIAAGIARLQLVCLFYFLCGVMEVLCGSIRGLGYSIMPTVVSLIGACGLRILWIATVFQTPAFHTLQGVFLTYPLTWSLTILAHMICFIWAFRRVKQQHLSSAPST